MIYLVTLVDVSAMLAILSQDVAIGAFAVESSDRVATPSVTTEERHNSAFVDVCFEICVRFNSQLASVEFHE